MTSLRQEALQIVNDMPDNLLEAFVKYIKNFQPDISIDGSEIYSKNAAMKAIEAWQGRNRAILESGIDWDKEIEFAVGKNMVLLIDTNC